VMNVQSVKCVVCAGSSIVSGCGVRDCSSVMGWMVVVVVCVRHDVIV